MTQASPTPLSVPPRDTWLSRIRWPLGLFAIVFVWIAATLWPVLKDPDQVLAFNDSNIESFLSPTCHFPDALVRSWDNQSFFGGGGGQYPLSVTGLGESIGAEFWRRWAIPWIMALCALGIYWALRQFRIGYFAAALASALIVFSGWPFNSAITGLAIRLIALTCAAVALGFVERGRCTGKWLPYVAGGGFLGLAVAEVPDVGLLFALSTSAVFWWTHLFGEKPESPKIEKRGPAAGLMHAAFKFAIYVAFSLLIGWQTVNVMFATQVQGVTQGAGEAPEARYNWATQWSLPPAELWNTVSGSYFGTSVNSPEKPYWGRVGQDANWEKTRQGMRNFALTGWHIGVIPCTMVFALLVFALRSRRAGEEPLLPGSPWLWLITGGILVTMMLMWGRFFFVYKLFWSLPFMDTIRCADKWNGPFLLFMGLGTALILDAIWKSLSTKTPKATSLWRILTISFTSMAGLALTIALVTSGNRDAFITARTNDGYQNVATLMWNNAVNASFKVFFIAGLCALGAWWVGRRQSKGTATSALAVLSVIGALALCDLTYNNLPYVNGHKYKHLLEPNPLTDYLDAHRTEGRIKLMPPNHQLLNNIRMSWLQIKGYDLFDPISVSRMPADYAALFNALGNNPARLWELGSIRYFIALPGVADELNKMDGRRGRFVERLALGIGVLDGAYIPTPTDLPNQRYLRVVEFTGALPKFSVIRKGHFEQDTPDGQQSVLQKLAAASFDPRSEVFLSGVATTPVQVEPPASTNTTPDSGHSVTVITDTPLDVELKVKASAPCYLLRSCKYDKSWTAKVDGHDQPVIKANFLFQAIKLEPGDHLVSFSYTPPKTLLNIAAVGRILLVVLVIIIALTSGTRLASLRRKTP